MLDHREDLGLDVAVISFAIPEMLRLYREEHGLQDVRLLTDPERAAYAAFGFGHLGAPRLWRWYAELLACDRRPQPPRDGTSQLGGDVLVGPEGRVRWVHRSRDPEDRPSIEALRAARRAA